MANEPTTNETLITTIDRVERANAIWADRHRLVRDEDIKALIADYMQSADELWEQTGQTILRRYAELGDKVLSQMIGREEEC